MTASLLIFPVRFKNDEFFSCLWLPPKCLYLSVCGSHGYPSRNQLVYGFSALFLPFPFQTTAGPWWYCAPPGQRVVADTPTEVAILAKAGISGANNWPELADSADGVTRQIRRDGLWTKHECDGCSKMISATFQS